MLVNLAMLETTAAQTASPQHRPPAIDSTHVFGQAIKVMPDFPIVGPGGSEPNPSDPTPRAPATIAELIAAFEGVILDYPRLIGGTPEPAMRMVLSGGRAAVQQQYSGNWYDRCHITPQNYHCFVDTYSVAVSPEGVFTNRANCLAGEWGQSGGSAEFRWADFVGFGGQTSTEKHWTLERSSLWSSCRADVGSND